MRCGPFSDARSCETDWVLEDEGVGDAVDAGQRVAGGNGFGLHAGGHGSCAAWAGERQCRDMPEPPSCRRCLEGLLAGDARDALACDLLAAQLPAEYQRGE